MKIFLKLITFVFLSLTYKIAFADPAAPIRIGAVLALTSEQAAPSRALQEGMELALEEVNQQPLWQGRKLQLIVEDGKLQPKESFTAAQKLIEYDKVEALLLESAIETKSAANLIQKRRIPAITLWDASPELEALGSYIFSIGLWTPGSAQFAATFAAQRLKSRSAYLLNSEDEWSLELEKTFRDIFKSHGGTVIGVGGFSPSETDYRTGLLRARATKPDVLYVTVGYNLPSFFKQLRAMRWDIPIITSDIVSNAHLKEFPKLFEGIYQTQIYTPLQKRTKAMLALYQQKFHRDCDWIPWVAWGYDAIHVLAETISKSGLNAEKIASQLRLTSNFEGASGMISMNGGQSSKKMPAVFQIINDTFVVTE